MAPQTHVIRRNIVEVTISGEDDPRPIQDAVSRVMRTALAPLIQRRCDELSEPETIHRLDRVEVDLGYVASDRFEEALTRAIEAALAKALAEAMRNGEDAGGGRRVSKTASCLELIDYFVRTGALPWWADRGNAHAVSNSLQFLSREAPRELAVWLQRLTRETAGLRRLVGACTDEDLETTLGTLRPDAANLFRDLAEMLRKLSGENGPLQGWPPGQLRREAWLSVLAGAAARGAPTDRADLRRDVFRRLAAGLEMIVARRPDKPSASGGPLDELFAGITPFLEANATHERAELRALLDRVEADGTADSGADSSPFDDLRRWLNAALATGTLPEAALRLWLARQRPLSPAEDRLSTCVRAALAVVSPKIDDDDEAEADMPGDAPLESAFSDEDAFSVDNAGLVLLWPFLDHFFTRVGLLEKHRFKDETAQYRATGLLQFLLTEERTPPEHQLPLNKVLCGLQIEAVFDLATPVTDEEAAECGIFLAAVIERAPILQQMSLPGFRGTFLARKGQLSVRDGAWLLRVERETYDVVLDQFPWSTQWVHLPWMKAPMYVEW
jgi:hypothetical protein